MCEVNCKKHYHQYKNMKTYCWGCRKHTYNIGSKINNEK